MPQPDAVRLHREAGEALSARRARDALPAEDRRVLVQRMRWYFWRRCALQEARGSLKRLRRLRCGDRRKKRQHSARGGSSGPGAGDGPSAAASGTEAPPGGAASGQGIAGAHRAGHGRQGAEAYVEAAGVVGRHETLAVGERCPVCGRGRRYRWPAGVERRLDGNARLSALRSAREQRRCSACGEVSTAQLPGEGAAEKDRARARAVVAVGR
jgi:hypothetical protein